MHPFPALSFSMQKKLITSLLYKICLFIKKSQNYPKNSFGSICTILFPDLIRIMMSRWLLVASIFYSIHFIFFNITMCVCIPDLQFTLFDKSATSSLSVPHANSAPCHSMILYIFPYSYENIDIFSISMYFVIT